MKTVGRAAYQGCTFQGTSLLRDGSHTQQKNSPDKPVIVVLNSRHGTIAVPRQGGRTT
jgi:hypothetical protein